MPKKERNLFKDLLRLVLKKGERLGELTEQYHYLEIIKVKITRKLAGGTRLKNSKKCELRS
jgi:hypothetical protein